MATVTTTIASQETISLDEGLDFIEALLSFKQTPVDFSHDHVRLNQVLQKILSLRAELDAAHDDSGENYQMYLDECERKTDDE